MGALVAVTALGIVGSVLVCYFPYALLLQGQPFRVLWLVQTLQAPLAVLAARNWWTSGRRGARPAAVLLVGYLALGGLPGGRELVLCLILFLCVGQFLRVTRSTWKADWVWLCLAWALVATAAVRVSVLWVGLIFNWDRFRTQLDLHSCLLGFVTLIVPGFRLLLAMAALGLFGRLAGFGRTFRRGALASFLAIQFAAGALPELPGVRERVDSRYGEIQFIRHFLRQRHQTHVGPPTVYWPSSPLNYVWFDLEVDSYFSIHQLSGIVFSRGTAMEGRRRADLVAPFEIEPSSAGSGTYYRAYI